MKQPSRFRPRARTNSRWLPVFSLCALLAAQALLFPSIAAGKGKPAKFNLAYTGLGGVMISVWVTKEGGYFEKNELGAESIYIASSSRAIQAMLAGDVDLLTSSAGSVVQANAGGADLMIVAGQVNRMVNSIVTLPEIKTFADLKGKSLGVTRFGSYTDFEARYVLNRYGIQAGKDVAILQMGGQVEIFAGLMARKVHSGVLAPPFLQKALEKGMHELPQPGVSEGALRF